MSIHTPLLQQLGLSEAEAIIYEALLEKGRSSASEIHPSTKLTRPNLYYNLGLLKEKGLITQTEGKRSLFEAVSPKRLDELAAENVKAAEEIRTRIHASLPELASRYELSTERPIVWYRGGVEGMAEVYKNVLEDLGRGDELLIFASEWDRTTPELNALIDRQVALQRKKEIKVRVLVRFVPNVITRQWISDLRKNGVDPRILYDTDFSLPSQLLLWKHTVAFTSLRKDLMTTVVQNEDVAASMRKIFEALWATGKADVKEALAK